MISSGSEFRPPPPPAFDSAQKAQELAEVKNFPRPIPASGANFSTTRAAYFWQRNTAKLWNDILTVKLFEYQLDRNPPRAARAYALMSVAAHDGHHRLLGWEVHVLGGAPQHARTEHRDALPEPESSILPVGALDVRRALRGSARLLFPRDADYFTAQAQEGGSSRLWAGIHFRSDIEAGLEIGRAVAQKVIERAKNDGSQ